ncbi:PEP-CTERM sorting domain-containing protein [Akkermansiaceae bacterium]|nr:PEP-CTERM sorting domain-containing protein [Akkermansiaceae bacterium]
MKPHSSLALVTALSVLVMPAAPAALLVIDLGANSGSAAGWDVFSSSVTDAAVTDQNAVDNDVTLSITGILGNNNPSPAGATTVDGVTVPLEANNDYVWGDNQGHGGSILFEFKNLDAGSYNVSVFAGRTNDANQEGTIWIGAIGDEPAQNTGNFANSSSTLAVSIGASDSLFYRHSPGTDWVGGTSGIIVNPVLVPEPSAAVLLSIAGLGLLRRRRVCRG